MKRNWFIPRFFQIFFMCEVLIFSSIQIFNLAFRMDVIATRIELGVLFFFIPWIAPFLLLLIGNDNIPAIIEKICHFVTTGLYLLCFLITQINSWQNFVFSLNLTSFIWFLTISMTSISLIVSMGKNQFRNVFLTDSHYNFTGKNNRIEGLISLLFFILCVGVIPLLKYPIFYYSITFSIHLIYGSILRVPLVEKDQNIEINIEPEYLTKIWNNTFQNSTFSLKLVRFLDRAFLVVLYPIGWFIWADFWTVAVHPDYYFNVFYFLMYTPFLYLGWWLYRFRGKHNRVSFYLTKHLIITVLILSHFIGFNYLAPFIIGYSLGFILTRLRQHKFRMKVIAVCLIQILLIAGFAFMLIKWVAPFLYEIGIYLTYSLILFAVFLFFIILGVFLFNILTKNIRSRSDE